MPVLLHRLIENAANNSRRPAFAGIGTPLDYGGFLRLVRSIAGRMHAKGVLAGDRIVLCAPNSVELAASYFAIHWVGAIASPVDPGLSDSALAGIVGATSAKLLVSHRQSAGVAAVTPGQLAADPSPAQFDPLCGEDDVADILFTTGTTGERKGVVLTHSRIAQAALNIATFIGNDADSVEMVPLPLSHSFGLGRLRSMAFVGNTLVLERGMANAGGLLKRMNTIGVTGFACVPTGWNIIMRLAGDQFNALGRSLKYVEIGSMPMAPNVRQWLMEALPQARLCHHYGLTEASRAAFTEYHADAHKSNTIGKAAPNVQITVRDERGVEAPPGIPGELVIQGGMVLREYWQRPDLSHKSLTEWGFKSGDAGWRDRDGYLYLQGRKDDLINVGGKKVSPDEVEEALRKFAGVEDAACIGVADPEGISGQVVKAFLVTSENFAAERLREHLRNHLEEYQLPQVLERVREIPRTESGKVQRHTLRGDAS